MAGTRVKTVGADLDAAEEARKRISGIAPPFTTPEPAPEVETYEPPAVSDEIQLAPEWMGPEPETVSLPPSFQTEARPDWDARLKEARAQGDEGRFGAGIVRIGDNIRAGFTGRKQESPAADALERDAAVPEQRVLQDMAMDQKGAKSRLQDAANDPNSPQNIAFRQTIRSRMPSFALALGEGFNLLTQGQLEKHLGQENKNRQLDLTEKTAEAKVEAEANKAEFNLRKYEETKALNEAKFRETLRNNNEKNAIGWTMATRTAQEMAANGGLSDIDVRRRNASLENLGKNTSKLAELASALQGLDELAPGITDGKLPKEQTLSAYEKGLLTKLPGGAGTRLLSAQQRQLKMAAKDFQDIVQRARSGAVLNTGEIAVYDTTFGSRVLDDPRVLAEALKWFKARIYTKLQTAQAPYSDETGDPANDKIAALPLWENVPGTVSYRDPFWKSVGGPGTRAINSAPPTSATVTPGAPQTKVQGDPEELVPVISPDGKSGKIPRKNLDKALSQGFKLKE